MVRFLVKGCVNKIEVTTYGGGFEQLPLGREQLFILKLSRKQWCTETLWRHCCGGLLFLQIRLFIF